MLWYQGAQDIRLSNGKLKSALKCNVWSQCTLVPDRQTDEHHGNGAIDDSSRERIARWKWFDFVDLKKMLYGAKCFIAEYSKLTSRQFAKYWNTLLLQPRNTLYRVADSFSAVVVFIYSAAGPMACNFANKMYICASRVKVPPPLDDSQTQRMPIRGTVRHAQRACEITIICRPKEHVCDTAGLFLPVLSIKYRQKGKNISRRLSALVLKTSIFKLFPSAIYMPCSGSFPAWNLTTLCLALVSVAD